MFSPGQRAKGCLRGPASGFGLASGEIADDPQIIIGSDNAGTGDHRGIHRLDRGKGPAKEAPHRVVREMRIGGKEMGHV